jgi:hypothetical protein
MYRLHCATALSVIIAGASGVTGAQATVRVGGAADIVRNVSGSLPGQTYKKAKGDDVYENEFISTKAESTAQIVFVDQTHINLGPTTTMKIDRVVFNPNQSVRALTVSAGAGAMRWISGDSASSAYEIKTPTAAIKVEGTTFDLIVESKRTTVLLQDGKVEVCSIGAPQQCKTLSERGDIIVATSGALEGPRRGGPGPSDFAALCLSVASQNCGITTDRGGPSPQPPPSRETRKYPAEPSQPSKSGTYKLESAPSAPPVTYPPPTKIAVPNVPPVIHPLPPKTGGPSKPPTEIYPRPPRHYSIISSRLTDYGPRPQTPRPPLVDSGSRPRIPQPGPRLGTYSPGKLSILRSFGARIGSIRLR